jgi:hypothetical protein
VHTTADESAEECRARGKAPRPSGAAEQIRACGHAMRAVLLRPKFLYPIEARPVGVCARVERPCHGPLPRLWQ